MTEPDHFFANGSHRRTYIEERARGHGPFQSVAGVMSSGFAAVAEEFGNRAVAPAS